MKISAQINRDKLVKNWKKIATIILYLFLISSLMLFADIPSLYYGQSYYDGALFGSILGGMLTYGAFGLIAYSLSRKSIASFYLASFIFALVSSNTFMDIFDNDQTKQESTDSENLAQVKDFIDADGIDDIMEEFVALEQTEYPKVMSSLDTVTRVFYIRETHAKVYNHVLPMNWRSIFSESSDVPVDDVEQYFPELMVSQTANTLCSYDLNVLYFNYGVKIINIFSLPNGEKVFDTETTIEDCKPGSSNVELMVTE